MVSSWKKYWFVLEGRLLLYYRSKDEYAALSPYKGAINLGPPASVKSYPSTTCVFQIETRSTTITLVSLSQILRHAHARHFLASRKFQRTNEMDAIGHVCTEPESEFYH